MTAVLERSGLAALVDAVAGREPGELLVGPLTAPEQLVAGADGPGLAVLFWRATVHVLVYDRGGDAGCPQCLAGFVTRHQVAGHDPAPAPPGPDAATSWRLLGPALRAVVVAVAAGLRRDRRPAGTLAVVDRATGTVREGVVPPRAGCPACPPRPARTTVTFGSAPDLLRTAPGTLRSTRPLPPTEDYVGAHTLFREPRVDLDGPVPAAQIGVPLRSGDLEPGIGRCRDVARSRVTAVLEGLERYTGFHFAAGEGVVEASLDELGPRAIDPRTLGAHSAAQYARPGFPYVPLARDERVRWVEVTPVGGGPARYLPEVALSWARRPGARAPLHYDTSNGFALGRTPEEATLHGLLEIVERDAFLLTWYRRLLLPEIRLGAADRDVADLVDRVGLVTGFTVRLYWAALDTGIPVVVALARRETGTGPCTFVSAGASLSPRAAAESAILEVAAILSAVVLTFDEHRADAERMAADFGAVTTMGDHSLVGALPSSTPWFDFLLTRERPRITLAEAAATSPVHATLDADLEHVRARIAATGATAYAADVTTPELRRAELVCTRAFVPGFLPMTFGHDTRRLDGLPRLTDARLPHASLLAPGQTPADLPPHPFP